MVIRIIIAFIVSAVVCFSQEQPQPQTANLENSIKDLQGKIDSINKTNYDSSKKLAEIEKEFSRISDSFTRLGEKFSELSVKLNFTNEEILKLNTSQSSEKKSLETIKESIEGFKLKFDIIQDEIKVKTDDIGSLRQTLSILKSNLDSNIEDTVACKKALREIQQEKTDKGVKVEKSVLEWEYWGVVASGVAVLALIFAVGK